MTFKIFSMNLCFLNLSIDGQSASTYILLDSYDHLFARINPDHRYEWFDSNVYRTKKIITNRL